MVTLRYTPPLLLPLLSPLSLSLFLSLFFSFLSFPFLLAWVSLDAFVIAGNPFLPLLVGPWTLVSQSLSFLFSLPTPPSLMHSVPTLKQGLRNRFSMRFGFHVFLSPSFGFPFFIVFSFHTPFFHLFFHVHLSSCLFISSFLSFAYTSVLALVCTC